MSGSLEEDLREETLKGLQRAEDLRGKISHQGDQRFLDNISAYISDSKYFLDKGDLIRAFESVVWAWAWMEIGLEMGILVEQN
jgi:uncharacterized protein